MQREPTGLFGQAVLKYESIKGYVHLKLIF